MTESGDSKKASDEIDGPDHPRFKKMMDFVLKYEGGGPYRKMDEKNELEVVVCSDCFQNEGLRLDAFIGGIQDNSTCKRCASQAGKKLTRAHLEVLANRFFVRGTFQRVEYGGAPIIQFNGRRETDIQIPNWLAHDIGLFEDFLGIGFFYYGPRTWMIGEVTPLLHLQENESRGAVIQRILKEYPTKLLGPERIFYRLRMNPADAANVMEFDSPPEEFLGRGRFDRKHLPIMYASPDLEVCIHECRVSAEDDLFFATLVPQRDLRFLDLTALLPYEDTTEFESLDMATHLLFLAGSHSYDIARDIAFAAHEAGFHGILYPSYFSLLRTGSMPFETVFGISHRKIDRFTDNERAKTVPNIAVFGRPISEGLVQVKCINRLRLERVAYRYHFGPVGYHPHP
jgi:RES domain